MRNFAFAFISYDPWSDQHLNPTSGDWTLQKPTPPQAIVEAVPKALSLLNAYSLEQAKTDSVLLFKLGVEALPILISKISPERNWASADDAELIYAALSNSAEYDLASKSRLMALLCLALAGDIYNTLWPSPEYLSAINATATTILDTAFIEDWARVAFKAASYAEQFARDASLENDARKLAQAIATDQSLNANNVRHASGNALKTEFVQYYNTEKDSGIFHSRSQAAEKFYQALPQERQIFAPTNYKQTLLDALRAAEKQNAQ